MPLSPTEMYRLERSRRKFAERLVRALEVEVRYQRRMRAQAEQNSKRFHAMLIAERVAKIKKAA